MAYVRLFKGGCGIHCQAGQALRRNILYFIWMFILIYLALKINCKNEIYIIGNLNFSPLFDFKINRLLL